MKYRILDFAGKEPYLFTCFCGTPIYKSSIRVQVWGICIYVVLQGLETQAQHASTLLADLVDKSKRGNKIMFIEVTMWLPEGREGYMRVFQQIANQIFKSCHPI